MEPSTLRLGAMLNSGDIQLNLLMQYDRSDKHTAPRKIHDRVLGDLRGLDVCIPKLENFRLVSREPVIVECWWITARRSILHKLLQSRIEGAAFTGPNPGSRTTDLITNQELDKFGLYSMSLSESDDSERDRDSGWSRRAVSPSRRLSDTRRSASPPYRRGRSPERNTDYRRHSYSRSRSRGRGRSHSRSRSRSRSHSRPRRSLSQSSTASSTRIKESTAAALLQELTNVCEDIRDLAAREEQLRAALQIDTTDSDAIPMNRAEETLARVQLRKTRLDIQKERDRIGKCNVALQEIRDCRPAPFANENVLAIFTFVSKLTTLAVEPL